MIKIDFEKAAIPPWMLNALERHGIVAEGKSYLECEAALRKIPRETVRLYALFGYEFEDNPQDGYDEAGFDCPF